MSERSLAVLGHPVAHSLSPVMHAAAYQALGLDWGYGRADVREHELAGFLEHAWMVDSTYAAKIVAPLRLFSYVIATLVDQMLIDGLVNGAGRLAMKSGSKLRSVVDGSVMSYALWMGAGASMLTVIWTCF